MMTHLRLGLLMCALLFLVGTASAFYWTENSSIVADMRYSDVSGISSDYNFSGNGSWNVLVGMPSGGYAGYAWNGTSFLTDTSVLNHLHAGQDSTGSATYVLIDTMGFGNTSNLDKMFRITHISAEIYPSVNGDEMFVQFRLSCDGSAETVIGTVSWSTDAWQDRAQAVDVSCGVGQSAVVNIYAHRGTGGIANIKNKHVAGTQYNYDVGVVSDLGYLTNGTYTAPTIINSAFGTGTKSVFIGNGSGYIIPYQCSGGSCLHNSTIGTGLPDFGAYAVPSIKNNVTGDNTPIMAVGTSDGNVAIWKYSSGTWSQVSASAVDIGDYARPTFMTDYNGVGYSSDFYGKEVMWIGDNAGHIRGYGYSGGAWIYDSEYTYGIDLSDFSTTDVYPHILCDFPSSGRCSMIITNGSYFTGYDFEEKVYVISPTNASSQSSTFPPKTKDVTITWANTTGGTIYHLEIANDIDFNLMVEDREINGNTQTIALDIGDTYYLRVSDYSTGYNMYTSDTVIFSITDSSSHTGTAVHGIITDDSDDPLSGVLVTCYNSTWNYQLSTGSNGYYLCSGLENASTYYHSISKEGYASQSGFAVTTVNGTWTIQNFVMYPATQYFDKTHVRFIVQNLWGTTRYKDVLVNVYVGSGTTIYLSGTTDSFGSVTFSRDTLNEITKYHITCTNSTQGIDEELWVYPRDTTYYIVVSSTSPWTDYGDQLNDVIMFEVDTNTINSTHAYINVTYTDNSTNSNNVDVWINKSITSDFQNVTTVDSYTGQTGTFTYSFVVSNYEGYSYNVRFDVDHDTYGSFSRDYPVYFAEEVKVDQLPESVYLYLSVLLLFFTGGAFMRSSAEVGSLIVCGEAWVFKFWGWFDQIQNQTGLSAALILATIISLIAIWNAKSKQENVD